MQNQLINQNSTLNPQNFSNRGLQPPPTNIQNSGNTSSINQNTVNLGISLTQPNTNVVIYPYKTKTSPRGINLGLILVILLVCIVIAIILGKLLAKRKNFKNNSNKIMSDQKAEVETNLRKTKQKNKLEKKPQINYTKRHKKKKK
jgi:uncharacterized membrane protein YvbJ